MLEPALVPWDSEGRKMGFLPSRSSGSSRQTRSQQQEYGVLTPGIEEPRVTERQEGCSIPI